MQSLRQGWARWLLLVPLAASCSDRAGSPRAEVDRAMEPTAPSYALVGTSSQLLGRATFRDPKDQTLMVKRIAGEWHVEVKAKPALDVAMQKIAFPAGSQSTWHVHPGPVFIVVSQGTISFYEGDDPTCTATVRTQGQGFLDTGDHPHIARNESGAAAETVVTYLAPPGVPLKKDVASPGNCAF